MPKAILPKERYALMPKALWLLSWLRIKSMFRRLAQALQTAKGILTLILIVGLVALILGPSLWKFSTGELQPGFANQFENYVVLGILSVFVFGLIKPGHGAILYLPEEVEALFSAPFTRRQILTYKLVGSALRIPWIALFFAALYGIYFSNVVCAYIGILLTMCLLQYGGVLLALSGQVSYATLMNRNRQIVGIAVLVVMLVLAIQGFSIVAQSLTYESVLEWVDQICTSQVGSIVLSPVTVFTNLIFAEHIDQPFVISLSFAIGEIGLILVLILALDANFVEINVQESKNWMERVNRAKTGMTSVARKEYTRAIPMLPFWRGLGPIIWRQLLSVSRLGRSAFAFVVLLAGGIGVMIFAKQSGVDAEKIRSTICITLGMMTLMFGLVGPVGFRPDIERIGVFKGLPIPDTAIVVGQILGGVIVISSAQIAILLLFVVFDFAIFWVIAFTVVIPLNYLVLVVSNTMLLLFPVRTNPASQDAISGGQNLLSFFAVYLSLILVAIVIGLPTGLIFWGSESPTIATSTAILIGLLCCVVATQIARWAYTRFDVSVDSPS